LADGEGEFKAGEFNGEIGVKCELETESLDKEGEEGGEISVGVEGTEISLRSELSDSGFGS
jgi:hypothetical protein